MDMFLHNEKEKLLYKEKCRTIESSEAYSMEKTKVVIRMVMMVIMTMMWSISGSANIPMTVQPL